MFNLLCLIGVHAWERHDGTRYCRRYGCELKQVLKYKVDKDPLTENIDVYRKWETINNTDLKIIND